MSQQADRKISPVRRAYEHFAEKQNKELLEGLITAKDLRPGWTLPSLLAILLASVIHLGTLVILAGSILLVVNSSGWIISIILGFTGLGVVWIVRPRLYKWPTKNILPRHKYPTLYGLVDQAADALKVKHISGIRINADINASIGFIGWKRRSMLTLGLPLWSILTDQEKLALVAHELAHRANQDGLRGWYVRSAANSVLYMFYLLAPGYHQRNVSYAIFRGSAMAELFSNWTMYLVSRFPLSVFFVMDLFFAQTSRRQEYLADWLASTVAGSSATLGMLNRLQMTSVLENILRRAQMIVPTNPDEYQLLNMFRERALSISDADIKRAAVEGTRHAKRLHMDHPPTAYRIRLLTDRPTLEPKIVVSTELSQQIENELAGWKRKIQKQLLTGAS